MPFARKPLAAVVFLLLSSIALWAPVQKEVSALTPKQKFVTNLMERSDSFTKEMETVGFAVLHQLPPKYHVHVQKQIIAAAKQKAYQDRAYAAAGKICSAAVGKTPAQAYLAVWDLYKQGLSAFHAAFDLPPGPKPYQAATVKVLRSTFTLFGLELAASRCPKASPSLAAALRTPSLIIEAETGADRVLASARSSADALLDGLVSDYLLDTAGKLEPPALEMFAVGGYDSASNSYLAYAVLSGAKLVISARISILLETPSGSLSSPQLSAGPLS